MHTAISCGCVAVRAELHSEFVDFVSSGPKDGAIARQSLPSLLRAFLRSRRWCDCAYLLTLRVLFFEICKRVQYSASVCLLSYFFSEALQLVVKI